MTYRAPAFMVVHSVATRAIANLSTAGGTYLSDAHKRALIDFRQGEFAVYNAAVAAHTLDVDMGSAFLFNHCVIPQSHNLTGHTVSIQHDTANTWPSPTTVGTIVPANLLPIDLALSTAVGERYWRLLMIASAGTIAPSLSEFWLGTRFALGADSWVDPEFENGYFSPIIQTDYPGGPATVSLATARRRFSLTVRNLIGGSTDYNNVATVLRLGAGRPFWYWPPDDGDPGPYLVILERDGARLQEFKAPQAGTRYQAEISMVELAL